MQIKEEIKDKVCIFRLEGNFTYETKGPLKERIVSLLEEGYYKFIFNFDKLEFLDSAALGLLIKSAKGAFAKGFQIKICNANQRIKRVIELAKLKTLIDLVEDENEAMNSFL